AARALDDSPVVQEQLPRAGEAIGVSLLLWPAAAGPARPPELVAGFVHRRLHEYPVSGGSSTYREAIKDEGLVARCAAFLAQLGFTGVAMLEWKRDVRDGVLKLLECNPRFWGSLHQAVLAGVPFPALLARLARGEQVEPVRDYATDRRSRALFPGDLLHGWKTRRWRSRAGRTAATAAAPVVPPPMSIVVPIVVDELLQRDDPWPA